MLISLNLKTSPMKKGEQIKPTASFLKYLRERAFVFQLLGKGGDAKKLLSSDINVMKVRLS